MKFLIDDLQDDLLIDNSVIGPLVGAVLDLESTRADELSVSFVSTERICELHKQFFDDGSPTDCISFPIDQDDDGHYRLLGEVVVCPKTALQYVESNGGDISKEVTLYLVHGLLHLLGYDDDGQGVKKMRLAEEKHLQNLSRLGLLLKTSRKKVFADLS